MGKLIIPVGIPGSGKSTYGRTLANTTVLSSDAIRRELFGSADAQYSEEAVNAAVRDGYIVISEGMTAEEKEKVYRSCGNSLVYRTMTRRCKRALRKGKDVYYDATNISRRGRKRTLARFEGLYDSSEAVFFDIPLDVCKERNQNRTRKVPEEMIDHMYNGISKPTTEEGFSEIHTVTC